MQFCPHDLFHNTKADLGPCPNLHDEVVRNKYEKEAPSYTKTKFEDEFLKYCRSMLNEVERKIQKGEQRLAQSQLAKQDAAAASPQSKAEEQITMLTDKINNLVKEAERCGFEGNIEQAQSLLKLGDQYKSEREALKKGEGLSFVSVESILNLLVYVLQLLRLSKIVKFVLLGYRIDVGKADGSL